MLFCLFATFSFAALASAYQITSPGLDVAWTTAGPNSVKWQRVATDPPNFTMVLVNQNQGVLPGGQQVLVATVDGTQDHLTVPAPSGGFPVGQGFQVNFVKDAQNLNTILAQSGQFAITQSSVTPGASSTAAALTPANTIAQTTAQSAQTAAQLTDQSTQSATDSNINPTASSTSKSGAGRIAAAGSTGLILAALAVIAL